MEDLEHLWKLRDEYRARIKLLKLQQARYGMLPTGQTIELQQAERDLEIVEAQLHTLPPSEALTKASGPDVRLAVVEYQLKGLSDTLNTAMRTIDGQLVEIRDTAIEWRAAERRARIDGQERYADELRRVTEQRGAAEERHAQELRRVWAGMLIVATVVFLVLLWRL